MVTEEVPCVAPKPLPQMVTHAPLLFWPPVMGPLSRSEKKMRGGALCAKTSVLERTSNNRGPSLENLSINRSKIWCNKKQIQQYKKPLRRWDRCAGFHGSRTFCSARIHRGDHVEILLSRNGRCIGEEKGCRGQRG